MALFDEFLAWAPILPDICTREARIRCVVQKLEKEGRYSFQRVETPSKVTVLAINQKGWLLLVCIGKLYSDGDTRALREFADKFESPFAEREILAVDIGQDFDGREDLRFKNSMRRLHRVNLCSARSVESIINAIHCAGIKVFL